MPLHAAPVINPVTLPPWTAGRWYHLPPSTFTTSNSVGNTSLKATPFWVPAPVTLDRLAAEVTVVGDVGSLIRLGIYNDDGTGRPGTLVVDGGAVAGDAVAQAQVTISAALRRGWYWVAAAIYNAPVTQPTMRTISSPLTTLGTDFLTAPTLNANGFGVLSGTTVTGALPASFGTVASQSSNLVRIAGRAA